ncbi:hypothetical protein TSUD_34140 [Trifolium subterraneum]|uniref:Reverse transcriptase domain-containing protein n=1 Tax=Trifolium subterraneum TaxID=3900 RepID=A0A2Z6MYI5_TRISU|nr:hypothetical protein TSUD_34140 [Trifolium subterraneum]
MFKGCAISRDPVVISHLQYADDTMCIGEASAENLWTLKAILRSFEMASGLKVNFLKSGLMGINVGGVQREKSRAPWKEVLVAKYGNHILNQLDWSAVRIPSFASQWWKNLWALDKVVDSKNWLYESIDRILGNGTSTKYWTSRWIGDAPLSVKFPRLFSLSNFKDGMLVTWEKEMGRLELDFFLAEEYLSMRGKSCCPIERGVEWGTISVGRRLLEMGS